MDVNTHKKHLGNAVNYWRQCQTQTTSRMVKYLHSDNKKLVVSFLNVKFINRLKLPNITKFFVMTTVENGRDNSYEMVLKDKDGAEGKRIIYTTYRGITNKLKEEY